MIQATPIDLRPLVYHKVSAETAERRAALREAFYKLGLEISMLPDGDSKEKAKDHLEVSSMRAIQALAIAYGEPIPPGE